jgi:hypothetical protein
VVLVTNRRLRAHVRKEGRFRSTHLVYCKSKMPFEILKGCYSGLRSLKCIAVCRKVQKCSQEYVIHEVSRSRRGEYCRAYVAATM